MKIINIIRTKWIATLLVAALAGAASAQGMEPGVGQQHPGPGGAGSGASTDAMGMAMMGEVAFDDEAGFLLHMVLHHEEAVESAERLLEAGARDELLDFANGIVDAQRSEIAAMESWLEAWYPDLDREIDYEPMMQDPEGMTAEDAERSFLEGMIMHHMMAVRNARHLLMEGLAEHEEVEALAQAIVADQMRETEQMQAWLREWFDAPAGMGMGSMVPDATGAGTMGRHMMDPETMQRPLMEHGTMGTHGMMHMHGMMQECLRMMGGGTSGMMGPMKGMGAMHGAMPMTHGGPAAGFDESGVEALARAFLAGRGVETEIDRVESPRNVYRVTYRDGDAERAVLVDADSGVVTMETQAE